MIPVTHPTFTNPFNGFGDCKISYLSSVSGLVAWTDYIPVITVTASSSIEGRTEANGYQNVHPVGATGNVAWTDYIPVYEDATKTVPWSTDANGYIPVGMSEDGVLGFLSQAEFQADLTHSLVLDAGTGSPTFTRASEATFRDWEGVLRTVPSGCARFEGARMVRNLFTFTQAFDNAAWSKFRASISANATTAPDGTLTADKLVEDGTAANTHFIEYNTVGTVGAVEVLSIYAKPAGRDWLYLQLGNSHYAYFNVSTGVVGTVAGAGAVAAITLDEEGFYRCSLKATRVGSQINYVIPASADNTISYNGDGTSGLYLWGAQLEDVTGQADQTASEYVSVGVLSAPYHGAGVDGVEFFNTGRDGAVIPAATNTGYLAEGARTNLCLQSQTLGTTWAADGSTSVTADQYVAPDGTTTMDKVTSLAGTSQHYLKQGITFSAGVTTYSFYLRYVNNQWCALIMSNGGGLLAASFDLLNGVVGALGAGTTSTIQATAIADVYRVSITGTMSAGAGYLFISPNSTDTASLQNYTAAGTETVGAWGAQLELGSFASTYIATTTAAVTREADVLTYPQTGNRSATVGAMYAEATNQVNSVPLVSGDGSGWASTYLRTDSNTEIRMFDGTNYNTGATKPLTSTTPVKYAGSYSGSTMQLAASGTVAAATAFDGEFPTSNTIAIGTSPTSAEVWYGTIRNVRIWQRALSASEMQAITA